ncbi:MAG: hypothetical protein JNK05_37725 [Myxococcales bacterium]|nr:hypothetical protein [Myxococcales bacterium]
MTHSTPWFSIGTVDAPARCPRCAFTVAAWAPSLDHHVRPCGGCGGASLTWGTPDRSLWISVEYAPRPVASFLRWALEQLDELEFVELLASIEELFLGARSP